MIGRMVIDPTQAKILTYQLWTEYTLERSGDRVNYLATGRMDEANASRS